MQTKNDSINTKMEEPVTTIKEKCIAEDNHDIGTHILQSRQNESMQLDVAYDRLIRNRESITLIWFDMMHDRLYDAMKLVYQLRALNDYVLFYTNISLCIEYLASASKSNEQCIVVIHDYKNALMVHHFQSVRAVFILSFATIPNEFNDALAKYPKLAGVYERAEPMMDKLEQVVQKVEHDIGIQGESDAFNVFNPKERSLRDVRHESGPFMWCQVFKLMVMAMPETVYSRQQMIEECRSYYKGNPCQLANIEIFDQTYKATDAINWYTRSSFLYKLVNKALRTEDIAALYSFRYFIKDLCTSLEVECHNTAVKTCVYRGSIMSREELEKYSVGSLVATNGFLSCSRHLSVARMFISWDSATNTTPSRSASDPQQYVLFEIETNLDYESKTIMADISRLSFIPNENEILFTLGTVFEIVSIDYQTQHYLWYIQMRPSIEVWQATHSYEVYIKDRMAETHVDILFGILLADLSEYRRSLNYFEGLLQRMPSDDQNRGNCLYCVARGYRFIGDYSKALEYFAQAEVFQQRQLPSPKFDLARTLAGIGSTYVEMCDHHKALSYFKRTYRIYRTILPRNHLEVARTFNRLGYAFYNLHKHRKALKYYRKSMAVFNNTVPDTHPDKAQLVHNMGLVYAALNDHEQSLTYLQKALEMHELSLPSDHPKIADSCYNLSVSYKTDPQSYLMACELAKRALKIREKKLPPDHGLIREAKELVDTLQQMSLQTNSESCMENNSN